MNAKRLSRDQAAKGKLLRVRPMHRAEFEVFLQPPLLPGNKVIVTHDDLHLSIKHVAGNSHYLF